MKNTTKSRLGMMISSIMVIFLLTSISFAEAASEKVYTLKCQSFYGPKSDTTIMIFRILDALEKEFPKRLNIRRFYSSELVGKSGGIDALARGTIDLLTLQPCYYPGACPEGQWPWLPFMFDTLQESQEVWETTEVASIIKDSYEKLGIMVFGGPFTFAYEVLYTNKKVPPYHPSDVKGLKLRASGGIHSTWTEKVLGCSTINVLAAEQYVALQQGIIDGGIYPIYALNAYKYYEVQKYFVSNPPIFLGQAYAAWSKKTFDKLPPDIQAAIKRIALREARYCAKFEDEKYPEWVEILKKKGMTAISWTDSEIDKLRKASPPIWQEGYAAKNAKCARILDICMKFKGLK